MSGLFLNIALRSALIYVVVLLGLRLLGKRHVAQLSILDFVLILLISNAVQNAMVGEDTSLAGGIVAAVTLLALNYLFSNLLYRSRKAELILEGTPTLLIHNGEVILPHLAAERLTEDELLRVAREHGIEHLGEVKTAVMELDGTISIIPKTGGEKRIETFKHRRSRIQQRRE
jgi:uncharacterized membrane protein YcaP (DUF421 family)